MKGSKFEASDFYRKVIRKRDDCANLIPQFVAHANALLAPRIEMLEDIAGWAQATLTALNVSDVQSESPLHKKLREVMINYRATINEET